MVFSLSTKNTQACILPITLAVDHTYFRVLEYAITLLTSVSLANQRGQLNCLPAYLSTYLSCFIMQKYDNQYYPYLIFIILWLWDDLPACVCIVCIFSSCRDQKRGLDSLELELELSITIQGLGIEPWSFGRTSTLKC
jgi:hypothetical protein